MKLRRLVFTMIALLGALSAAIAADRYALVDISTAYVRSRPSHSGELVTQQLMGFPVKILGSEGEWYKVETIDGYEGYIISNTLVALSEEAYNQWKSLPRVVVTAHKELSVTDARGAQVSDVVPGAILSYGGVCPADTSMAVVVLPDGRKGLLDAGALTDITDWSRQQLSVDDVIAYGMDNIGAPYLWGGMSPKGMDCSGLTWTAYWLNGRLLRRDASKQALMGDRITDWKQLKAGDLAFFGNPKTGRITHVALLRDSNGNFVHSSAGRVRLNSLDPSSPDRISAKFLWGISSDNFHAIKNDSKSSWLFNK